MKKPGPTKNEAARLNKLKSLSILDTLPEQSFDKITRIAIKLFDVPIAIVSLVDENRQWFKSCAGLDASETSREISFCGHAILGSEVFVIHDTHKDERFADNPLVTSDPHIRFYAGCPIKTSDGSKLGTLCVIDKKPRVFSDEEKNLLSDLGAMVERELMTLELATIDELTHLYNRTGFSILARYSLEVCERENIPITLVYMDLNNLKLINDKFGHIEGDNALTVFANQLKNTFRESDIIARLGGDEFVALLTNHHKDLTDQTVVRFAKLLEKANQASDCDYTISFSYGVIEYNPARHKTLEQFLDDGDKRMYQYKVETKKSNNIIHVADA